MDKATYNWGTSPCMMSGIWENMFFWSFRNWKNMRFQRKNLWNLWATISTKPRLSGWPNWTKHRWFAEPNMYPLVNVYIAIENHHCFMAKSRNFLWPWLPVRKLWSKLPGRVHPVVPHFSPTLCTAVGSIVDRFIHHRVEPWSHTGSYI
jgi:hypothetical protein